LPDVLQEEVAFDFALERDFCEGLVEGQRVQRASRSEGSAEC
jgi:hypothetical protein